MKENETSNIVIIESTTKPEEGVKVVSRQTNPIQKRLLEYQKEKEKFSVLDLFRK